LTPKRFVFIHSVSLYLLKFMFSIRMHLSDLVVR